MRTNRVMVLVAAFLMGCGGTVGVPCGSNGTGCGPDEMCVGTKCVPVIGTGQDLVNAPTADFSRPRDLGGVDIRVGNWCPLDNGDGGKLLPPGSSCTSTAECASISACTFENFDRMVACTPRANLDAGMGNVCCVFVKTHDQVDGHVISYRDCGLGLECVNGCSW